VFEVIDDGVGFVADRAADGAFLGQGLTSLSDRLGAVAGRIEIESSLGAGTTIRGIVPA